MDGSLSWDGGAWGAGVVGRLLKVLLWLLLGLVMVRMAWVSDDAYITFRCISNANQGLGLGFNAGHRVQAYTHPLWMLLHLPFMALGSDPYWLTLLLSIPLALGAWWRLAGGLRSTGLAMLLPLVVLASKGSIEYATSGLENPLLLFLLGAFLIQWKGEGPRRLFWLGMWSALLLLTRMDALLLVAPALGHAFWQERSWRALWQLCLGMLPFVVWEGFALVYYGFPFPNTAYAKLANGIPQAVLYRMGLSYYADLLVRDPATLVVIAAGLVAGIGRKALWPVVLGLVLYLFYILRIGGDFMSGRFFVAPFFVAVYLLGHWSLRGRWRWEVVAVLVAVGGLLGPRPMLLFWSDYESVPKEPLIDAAGIADERAFYANGTSVLMAFEGKPMPTFRWADEGRRIAMTNPGMHQRGAIGMLGYFAGPGHYILDEYALSDAFLARLPALYVSEPRPGHFDRWISQDYKRSLASGQNKLQDPVLKGLYEQLYPITCGPIWEPSRLKRIAWLTLGLEKFPDTQGYKVPTRKGQPWPKWEESVSLTDNLGARLSLPPGHDRRLHFLFKAGLEINMVWSSGAEILGGEVWSRLGTVICQVPDGADSLSILPAGNSLYAVMGNFKMD